MVTDLANYVVKVAYSQILGAVVLAVLFTAALTYNILVVRSYAYTVSVSLMLCSINDLYIRNPLNIYKFQ